MTTKCSIIALALDKRNEDAPEVQKVLSAHGCLFKARLGLPRGQGCTDEGLIVLVAEGSEDDIANFLADLKPFSQVKVYHVGVC